MTTFKIEFEINDNATPEICEALHRIDDQGKLRELIDATLEELYVEAEDEGDFSQARFYQQALEAVGEEYDPAFTINGEPLTMIKEVI